MITVISAIKGITLAALFTQCILAIPETTGAITHSLFFILAALFQVKVVQRDRHGHDPSTFINQLEGSRLH